MLIFMTALEGASSAQSTVDDGLIRRIAQGDMEALRTLYEGASASIYGFALSITKDPHDAEDVLQDTILTVHSAASDYRPQGKPMAWIFTIARNRALMRLRERDRGEALDDGLHRDEGAFARIAAVEDRALIQALLAILDDQERQIVMLHAASGLKNREIAALLELPLNTVLSKYHRAIKKLRAAAEKEGFSHER